jgi:hypothetical protein
MLVLLLSPWRPTDGKIIEVDLAGAKIPIRGVHYRALILEELC